MAFPQLSFAPDRRSVQTTFYHFSERTSGDADKRGFSQQDSLIWALSKIYQSKFANISEHLRNTLVDILVTYVPLPHRNLTILAAANFIVYHMKTHGISMDFNPSNYATPTCDSPQQPCITTSPVVVSCKQEANSRLNPQNRTNFEHYYNYVEPYIISDVSGKKPEEILQMRAHYKITLLRYIIFIWNSLESVMTPVIGQTGAPTQGI